MAKSTNHFFMFSIKLAKIILCCVSPYKCNVSLLTVYGMFFFHRSSYLRIPVHQNLHLTVVSSFDDFELSSKLFSNLYLDVVFILYVVDFGWWLVSLQLQQTLFKSEHEEGMMMHAIFFKPQSLHFFKNLLGIFSTSYLSHELVFYLFIRISWGLLM